MADKVDPELLRRDIEARRHDLAASVGELREVVSDKLDVRKRAERAFELGKQRALLAVNQLRGKLAARPALVLGVALGLVSLGVVGFVARQHARPPAWRRQLERYRRALSEGVYVRIGAPAPR